MIISCLLIFADYDFKGLYESPAWRGLSERGYSEEDGALPRLHERKPSGDLHFSSTQVGQSGRRLSFSLFILCDILLCIFSPLMRSGRVSI